jgi:hypothetical protein
MFLAVLSLSLPTISQTGPGAYSTPTMDELNSRKKIKADSLEKIATIFDRVENKTIHFKKIVVKDSTVQATPADVEKNVFGFKVRVIQNITVVDSSTTTTFAGGKPIPSNGSRNPAPTFDTLIECVGVNIAKDFNQTERTLEIKKKMTSIVLPAPQLPPAPPITPVQLGQKK